MKIRSQFVIFFTSFMAFTMCLIAGVGITTLHKAILLISTSPNFDLLSIISRKFFINTIIIYLSLIFIIMLISIPIGLSLANLLTKKYLNVFRNILSMAKNRFARNNSNSISSNDIALLKMYTDTLVKDFEIVKDYEKSAAWKDGARFFLHEIKNPLTPLKLSAQNLLLNSNDNTTLSEDITRINKSIIEIEKIFGYFKDLVNIEFGQKEIINVCEFFENIIPEIIAINGKFPIRKQLFSICYPVLGESTLLKLLFLNLIKNGIEQDNGSFYVVIEEKEMYLEVNFKTTGVTIIDHQKFLK